MVWYEFSFIRNTSLTWSVAWNNMQHSFSLTFMGVDATINLSHFSMISRIHNIWNSSQ
jgi:hypothetical protein